MVSLDRWFPVGTNLVDLLTETGHTVSKSESRRLIAAGAVAINGKTVTLSDIDGVEGVVTVKRSPVIARIGTKT